MLKEKKYNQTFGKLKKCITFALKFINKRVMRPKKMEDKELIINLMSVLRKKGYEGSSLNQLADAAQLNKASLYHRFPGGKKEIADAALEFTYDWVKDHVYKLLIQRSIAPKERLNSVLKAIGEDLYKNGRDMCILRALSMDNSHEGLFGNKIKSSMSTWIDAFTVLGMDFGLSEKEATEKAVQVLVQIQGGLVVSEGLGSLEPFENVIQSLKNMY
ncbi:MAG: TetR/AcrR family transcriptional regulator [Allomuricauda sp.]|jgi:AcrR family transcriptional regulator